MVPRELILIRDPKVISVPVRENNDPLVDLKDLRGIFFHESSRRSPHSFRIRKLVAEKLLQAQKTLPQGIHFLVYEAYRPLHLQQEYFNEYCGELSRLHPNWNREMILEEASKYVAPPEIKPPHSTGGAVDVTLISSNGMELVMGTKMNAHPEESNNACYTFAPAISLEERNNRNLLITALSLVGFVNYPTEWWHWSYGDRYWAFHKREPFALFDTIEPK